MLKILLTRLKQGERTVKFPQQEPQLPDRFRGVPVIDQTKCPTGCNDCADACPTDAIKVNGQEWKIDLGRCLFCTDCSNACPENALEYSASYSLAVRKKEDLLFTGKALELAKALE